MFITHALLHASPQCLHAACGLPPTLHRRKITLYIRSKDSISNEEQFDDSTRGEESTNVPSVADVKLALGIEKKASSRPRAKKPGPKDMEFSGREEFEWSPRLQKLQQMGEWLVNEGETFQERLLVFVILLLPLWLFCVFVAAGFIHLPFSVPFLQN